MKTFKEYMSEETRDQKFARIRKDAAAFGAEIDAKRAAKQTPTDIFKGSRHSDGNTVQVSNQQKVTLEKPKIGTDDAVGKLLASKGYSRSGEKMRATSYPNVRQARSGTATDTKFKIADIAKKINTPSTKQTQTVQPKVGSLTAKQTGYPTAKKPSLAPAESQRASSGGSYKIQPGDNPTKIAQKLGLKSAKELEAKNPGILKRAKILKIGGTINR